MERKKSETNILVNKIRYNQLKEVFKQLKDIPYAIIKGEVLSLQAYLDIGYRSSGDIDILIPKKYISKLESILIINGFKPTIENTRLNRMFYMNYSHQIMPYKKKTPLLDVIIDVNFDIFWGEYEGKRIDIEEFLSNISIKNIYGCNVKVLGIKKAFIQLCLHHYKELNSLFLLDQHNCFKKVFFEDIYMILKNNNEMKDINEIFKICQDYEVCEYVYYIIFYTNQFYPDTILLQYLKLFFSYKGDKLINQYGLNSFEYQKWKISLCDRIKYDNFHDYIIKENNPYILEKINNNIKYFN